ncbi:hypothetical protein ADIWIN_3620 [Winogradskyella psychrotolerans RS-3]|uniref:DUF4251 domain-containing protein n=1 Tax=Winogradskyella psychrotolerans RS-3 TaxID=641526 RepID=S7WU58_9FLAO|nr:DUF4251 domain-containing protein [Winogradskyella psychrotolerans]EPR70264.1 hypothetical protein ADIWIN_3620 [Winogradskyella psychrotolerans RS-3]
MKKLVLLVLLFSLSASNFVTAQAKTSQKEMFATTYHNSKNAVKSQHYQFVANAIHDSEQREMLDGDTNQIRINKLDVTGQLHGFSKDRAIYTLKDSSSEISTAFHDEKQQISITIKMQAYTISIEVKPNGNAFLTLTGNDITKLEYIGKLLEI